LCALLFGLWACTPEAIQPPEPLPPLAAGAPQGNPEDVQEECSCQMQILGINSENQDIADFLMPDYESDFSFLLNDFNGQWTNLNTGQQGSFPTPFFDLPGTWNEEDCEQFQLISFDTSFTVNVTVRCFGNGKISAPDSLVWDDFTFTESYEIDWDLYTANFYRQYICRTRKNDEPDPCKQGPTPSDPPVKTL